jgi:hypothetical protein|tara:strand:- start:104 stop:457 length:354 start_codon:yes stop_codon:yes gene_type:complete
MKFIIYIFSVFLILITTGYSKEVCITNYGKDPVALILSHSMQWVERRRGRCLNTDDTKALIQNSEVKEDCSFEEKTTEVDLVNYACFRVKGEKGICKAEIESWEFPDDCEKRVKRTN